jgi:predicted metal-dependent phosphoesterase TrpH
LSLVLDLHNHSSCSYDASNRFAHYKAGFERGLFDVVAITDHNTMRAHHFFTNDEFRVIIGEEIDTSDGELIGLFLSAHGSDEITKHRPILDTAAEIKNRGGIVYLQHPYYRWLRRSHRVHEDTIAELLRNTLVDVIETRNGGAFMAESNRRATELARYWGVPEGAGSDAHHPGDIGRCTVRIPFDGDPFTMTNDDLLAGLRKGEIDDSRIRGAPGTLAARAGYAMKVAYGRLAGAEPKRRDSET